ncbi:MAG TPA: aminotransferase class V-fold PLP-dependent enzyme [Bacteroidales bacterium]|nr:aminotransferase class V-fold PLP-dependent enzyme [Bacteroidales bacterium]HOX73755.1 aminotransferase class V-fold PLP-dependent enzyme [Bacteroidales bacterium]HQM68955.1 aminotransferase class V-fold PLP-dependent enzyme [Bacteroidales bacterium]
MKRREVIKGLTVLPVAGAALSASLPLSPFVAAPVKRDLFAELGLRRFINAAGTYTFMTASLLPEEVVEAMVASSKEYVLLDDVQDKVGEKIAAICHAEAATVTAGCWSAMVLGTAGVLTGKDQNKIGQLPDVSNMKSEVITQNSHNTGYVHALKNTGVRIVPVETAGELEDAINEKTAMLWFLNYAAPSGKIQHEEFVALGKKHNIPVMIDIAADVPPVENLWKYNDMGFDLVCISGGKALRGPQSAGILMGRKDLIEAARLNAPPRGGNIGRGMKVNKEEVFGMYAAIDRYIRIDHEKEWKIWEDRIALIENAVKKVNGVTTTVSVPPVANHTPTLNISWDINRIKVTRQEFQERLRRGNPSIEVVAGAENSINITVFMLEPKQERIVAARIYEELTKAQV